ncbi:MAG TPA: 23S rRNA pseudouridine(2604) synthase RluF [Flavipsychrobacter sp.]|nr:23S rRNA pseudouridine(2604) synthase RluF [Flavipsychrobacter sp.]
MSERENDGLISLNKYISSTGFCSRRDADKLIEQARVTVNGKLVIDSIKISITDRVEVDGEKLKPKKQPLYIAFNKPKGVTSTTDPKDKTNIIYFLNYPKRIFPIGRLDKDSDGLIFLTNDGDIVNKILRAANNHEKEYVVVVDKPLSSEFVRKMENGVPILNTVTKKCKVRQEGNKRFRIVLTQGLNRQIRRMCEALDYKVIALTRTRIMNVTLSNIPVGKWRYLTSAEVEELNKLVSTSSKTEEASYEERPKAGKKDRQAKPKNIEVSKTRSEETGEKKKKTPFSYKEFRRRRK